MSVAAGTVPGQGAVAHVLFEVLGNNAQATLQLEGVTANGAGGTPVNIGPPEPLNITLQPNQ